MRSLVHQNKIRSLVHQNKMHSLVRRNRNLKKWILKMKKKELKQKSSFMRVFADLGPHEDYLNIMYVRKKDIRSITCLSSSPDENEDYKYRFHVKGHKDPIIVWSNRVRSEMIQEASNA